MTNDRAIISYCLLLALVGAGANYALLTLGYFDWLYDMPVMQMWRW